MDLVMTAATNIGTIRKINEDFFFFSQKHRLMVLCDGMGGHKAGETASRVAGETVREVFLHEDLAELAHLARDIRDQLPMLAMRLVVAVRIANRRLRMMSERNRELRGMGTTVAAMAFTDEACCALHVGDSRIYRLRENRIDQLTVDHSWINELLQDREISEDEVAQFRKKNVLTRALGTHPKVKVDVQWFPIKSGDKYLLCTDGLHNALNDDIILSSFTSGNGVFSEQCVENLVQVAAEKDGSDNITAGVVVVKKVRSKPVPWDPNQCTIAEEPDKQLHLEDRFLRKKFHPGDRRLSIFNLPTRVKIAIAAVILMAAVVSYAIVRSLSPPQIIKMAPSEAYDTRQENSLPPVVSVDAPRVVSRRESPQGDSSALAGTNINSSTAKPDSSQQDKSIRADLSPNPKRDSLLQTGRQIVPAPSPTRPPAEPDSTKPSHLKAITPEPPAAANNVAQTALSFNEQDGGRIFLTGLSAAAFAAVVFANGDSLGPVSKYAVNGFALKPGVYTIAIKDSSGRLLHQLSNVIVARGDIKPLEFRP